MEVKVKSVERTERVTSRPVEGIVEHRYPEGIEKGGKEFSELQFGQQMSHAKMDTPPDYQRISRVA